LIISVNSGEARADEGVEHVVVAAMRGKEIMGFFSSKPISTMDGNRVDGVEELEEEEEEEEEGCSLVGTIGKGNASLSKWLKEGVKEGVNKGVPVIVVKGSSAKSPVTIILK